MLLPPPLLSVLVLPLPPLHLQIRIITLVPVLWKPIWTTLLRIQSKSRICCRCAAASSRCSAAASATAAATSASRFELLPIIPYYGNPYFRINLGRGSAVPSASGIFAAAAVAAFARRFGSFPLYHYFGNQYTYVYVAPPTMDLI